jgi:type II pantothenate kinase
MFDNGATIDFHQVRDQLKPRPWLFDDLDAWLNHSKTYRNACMFVDNAGPDIVLGMIPFARDLLIGGTRVLLAANDTPTLNDITVAQLHELIEAIALFDDIIKNARADGRLEIVGTGNGYPLIDLTTVSQKLVDAVTRQEPDLVVLEGMGRAVESNLNAQFTCDSLKLAMVKDAGVARMLGGSMYDLVMRFETI